MPIKTVAAMIEKYTNRADISAEASARRSTFKGNSYEFFSHSKNGMHYILDFQAPTTEILLS